MPELSRFTPVWGIEQFTPGKKDGTFRLWNTESNQKIMDLYVDGALLSFDHLCQRYQIPIKTLFQVFTIKKLPVRISGKKL